MDYIRDEHRVHLVCYHLVFCPARRKKCLVGDIARDCDALIRARCENKGWLIAELAVHPDHVHLFVQVYPTTPATDVLKEVKGVTSRELRLKYPTLLKLPSLWTRSYFAATAGNVSAATIAKYIAAQTGF